MIWVCLHQLFRFANTQLQHEIFYPASVPFRNTFLIVGGRCNTQCDPDIYHSEILEYNPDDETWTVRPETLDKERSHLAALLVEDSVLNCI